MSLLVGSNDLIPISVFYTISTNKFGVKFIKVLDETKAKEMLALPDSAAKVKMLNTKWRPQTWQAQNECFASSTVYNPAKNGASDINWSKFNQAQLSNCLVDWDLTDDAGRPIPVSEEYINSLHASIANALVNRYNQAISLEEGELGESQR